MIIYKVIRNVLNNFGFDIHSLNLRSGSMYFPLSKFKNDIDLVIDVGVAYGTPDLYRAFPNTRKILIEPIDYFVDKLNKKRRLLNAIVIKSCASDKRGSVSFFIRNKKSTSSINRGSSYSEKVEIVTERLDVICSDYIHDNQNICLKIDTEGSEIKVLKGAESILCKCKVVVAEATTYPTLEGSNSMLELIDFMATKGFRIYDFVNIRKVNSSFNQCDIIFIPE